MQYKPTSKFWVFEERMIARFWEKRNRLGAPEPLPVAEIIHHILPAIAKEHRIKHGDFVFAGLPYLTRDLVTLSSTVQWFGTNVGRNFIDSTLTKPGGGYHPSQEFVVKLERENKHRDMYAFLSHRCTNRCWDPKRVRINVFDLCIYDSRQVTKRDRAMIDGLMSWLGTDRGRTFLCDFRARRTAAHEAADRRRSQNLERRRAKAA